MTERTARKKIPSEEILDDLKKRFSARAAAYDRSGEIALDNLADLRDAGLLALAAPTAYGGHAIDLREIVRIIGTIAKGDPSTALILTMQYFSTQNIARSRVWRPEVRHEVLTSVERNGALINALRVEPELGTPVRGGLPATSVRQEGSVWKLNGQKIFSTGSNALTWGLVWARTEGDTPRAAHILVPLSAPGVRIENSWHQMGMRATGSHTVTFDNVSLPERYLADLIHPAPAPAEDNRAITWINVVIAALYTGIACSAKEWFVSWLHTRTPSNLGRSLATLPRFHALLGEIDALLLTNKALIEYGLCAADTGRDGTAEGGLLKYITTENAITAVERMISAAGNPGLSQDNPLERHYRDVLCGRVHTPQSDMALEVAGRAALHI